MTFEVFGRVYKAPFKVSRIFVQGFEDISSYPQRYVKYKHHNLTKMFEVLRRHPQGFWENL